MFIVPPAPLVVYFTTMKSDNFPAKRFDTALRANTNAPRRGMKTPRTPNT